MDPLPLYSSGDPLPACHSRAGSAGLAVSFFVPSTDRLMAKKLVRVIREAGQEPAKELCAQVLA